MIQFLCPGCRREYRVQIAMNGKVVRCKYCGDSVRVPMLDPTEELTVLDSSSYLCETPLPPRAAAPLSCNEATPSLIGHPKSRF